MLLYNHEKSNDSLRFGDDLDRRMRRPRRPGSYENRPMSRSLGREKLLRLRSRAPFEIHLVPPYQDFARIGLDPSSDSRQRTFLFAAPRRTRTAFSRTGRDAAGRRSVIRRTANERSERPLPLIWTRRREEAFRSLRASYSFQTAFSGSLFGVRFFSRFRGKIQKYVLNTKNPSLVPFIWKRYHLHEYQIKKQGDRHES